MCRFSVIATILLLLLLFCLNLFCDEPIDYVQSFSPFSFVWGANGSVYTVEVYRSRVFLSVAKKSVYEKLATSFFFTISNFTFSHL